jgi:hypothetical protein
MLRPHPSIEFVNVMHPLTEVIRDEYAEALRASAAAFHVQVATSYLSPGVYVFVVFRLHVRGARPADYLECVIINDRVERACDDATGEAILGEIVERGREPEGGLRPLQPGHAGECVRRAHSEFGDSLARRRTHLVAQNAAVLDRRSASVRFHLDAQLVRSRALLERLRAEGRKEQVLQMTRGRIVALEARREHALLELDRQRQLEMGYDEVASGILEVVR